MEKMTGEIRTHTMSAALRKVKELGGEIDKNAKNISVVTDETLSKQGRAADAKVVGSRLTIIEEKIDDLEAEVGDASLLLSLI